MGGIGMKWLELIIHFFQSLKNSGMKVTYQRVCASVGYRLRRYGRGFPFKRKKAVSEGDYERYVKSIERANRDRITGKKKEFVPLTQKPFVRTKADARVIAWYLPQYYQMKVNDRVHGRGFTEWSNSSQAIPLFEGHYQPHIPYDVGYYDLTNPAAMKRQAELAKMYGVYGFCFHWYWFGGKRIMERPCKLLLEHKEIALRFCFNWAAENWTSAWDGGTKEIIYKQTLSEGDGQKFMDDILAYMQDERYIRIDGKPILSIYRVDLFPKKQFLKFIREIRKIAKKEGFPDLYILITDRAFEGNVTDWGADALAEFPPAAIWRECGIYQPKGYINPDFHGEIYDLNPYVQQKKYLKRNTSGKVFRSALVSFDNTARRMTDGSRIMVGANPQNFKLWMKGILEESREAHKGEEQIVFVNSWNEWAGGSHLEPDMRYGYAFLQALKESLEETRMIRQDIVKRRWRKRKAEGILHINFYIHCIESMGDVVACEPIVRYLKRMDPDAKIRWIVRREWLDIVKYNPFVDECITVDCLASSSRICQDVAKKRKNIIIDCHYDGRVCAKTYKIHTNQNNPLVHAGTYLNYGSLLAGFCLCAGIEPLKEAPVFYQAPDVRIPAGLPKRYVVFHCRSAESSKDWTDEKWNMLANNVMQAGFEVVEIGLEQVIQNTNPKYHNCTTVHDLQITAAIIKGACCFIGIDSGFAHIANCMDVYGILIFGKYKNFGYPQVYSGRYADGTNASVIYAKDGAVAASVEEDSVFAQFRKRYMENDGVENETDGFKAAGIL